MTIEEYSNVYKTEFDWFINVSKQVIFEHLGFKADEENFKFIRTDGVKTDEITLGYNDVKLKLSLYVNDMLAIEVGTKNYALAIETDELQLIFKNKVKSKNELTDYINGHSSINFKNRYYRNSGLKKAFCVDLVNTKDTSLSLIENNTQNKGISLLISNAIEKLCLGPLKDPDRYKVGHTINIELFNTINSSKAISLEFKELLQKSNKKDLEFFISSIRSIVKYFNLTKDDPRLVFSFSKEGKLNFIIGQRFVLNFKPFPKNISRFGYISNIHFKDTYYETFSGKPETYYNHTNNGSIIKERFEYIIKASDLELKRFQKSSFFNQNNEDFKALIYSDLDNYNLFDHQPINETKYDLAFKFLEQYRAKNPDFRYFFRNDAPESEIFRNGNWFPTVDSKAKVTILKIRNIKNELIYVQLRFYIEKSKIVNVRVEFEFPGGIETTPQLINNGDKIVQTLENFVNYLKREVTADNKVFFGLKNANKPLDESFSETMDFFIGELKKLENYNEIYSSQFNKFDECLTYVNDYLNGKIRLPKKEVTKEKKYPLNQILYGPPGTGKTFITPKKALAIINVDLQEEETIHNIFQDYLITDWSDDGQIAFCTFHQNFAYEDFIEGIKPVTSGGVLSYRIEDGIFKKLCERAALNPELNYVLIIDEINRGNVSSIFGELITLIEDNKREGEPNELSVILPYSKKAFTVPNNVYLIGTMNTADRSVEALDVALRRRFVFEEMLPDPKKLEGKKIAEISLQPLLETINKRLELMLDNDHTIGHAFFMNLKTEDDLVNVFKQKVIPLFQEYFFGDIKKIAMVLGPSFIKVIDGKSIKLKSSSFTKDLAEELKEKTVYKVAEFTIDAIKGILDQDTVTE